MATSRSKPAPAARPLPGSRPARAAAAHDYLIALVEEPEPEQPRDRADVVARGLARAEQFRARLEAWLAEQGLAEEVEAIGGPTAFGMLGIRCSERCASAIEALSEVDYVLRDAPMGVVRSVTW
jgi:hypothetical protein